MTVKAGVNLEFKLDDSGAVQRDLSTYVKKISVELKGHGLVDVTTAGAAGHTWASDELEDCSFVVDFMYDPTATTGPFAVLDDIRDYATAVDFEIFPAGNSAGERKLAGVCFLENLPVEATVGDMVYMNGCSFKVSGAVTVTTI